MPAFSGSQYIKINFLLPAVGSESTTGMLQVPPMTVDGENKFNSFEKLHQYSGSVGLSYQLSKEVTFKANVARGFRAPNFAELAVMAHTKEPTGMKLAVTI